MDCTICATERSRREADSASRCRCCCPARTGGGILPQTGTAATGPPAEPELVDVRAEGHDSEADFDAPDADREVSVSHRGLCARERRFIVHRTSFAKSRDRWELCHGRPIRRCRTAPQGRGRERPVPSGCLARHGDGWDVHGDPNPAPGRSRSSSPLREGHRVRVPPSVASARQSSRRRAGRGGVGTKHSRPSGRASECPRRPPRREDEAPGNAPARRSRPVGRAETETLDST